MIKIYGKKACPWCQKAKELAQKLQVDFEYIDIDKAGITKDQLSDIVGQPISTIPQIMNDEEYIGGFTEFAEKYQ